MARSGYKDNIVPSFAETNSYLSGYWDKIAKDELPAGTATKGSFNFILDKDGKWTTRGGSSYLGTKSTGTTGITSSAKLVRRDGVELPVVFYGTNSKVFHPDSLDWIMLETTYTTGLTFGRASGEKTTDNVNKLIFGNGTDNYRIWDGVTGKVASVTATTIVLSGSVNLDALGFSATGTISVDGTQYAYTGLSGKTFTGVSPDPSTGGVVADDPVISVPINNAALPLGSVYASLNGRVVVANKPTTARFGGGSIVGSKLNVYDDFAFSATRVAAEGFQLMMQEGGHSINAMIQYEGGLAVLKPNAISKLFVTLDANDFPSLSPLLPFDDLATGHVGNVGPKTAFALRNFVFFISPRKVIHSLQRVAAIDTPQVLPFSDRLQNTCDDMTWDSTSCGAGYNYIALFCGKQNSTDSVSNQILVYDSRFDCWWTPITGIEASSFFVYGGDLYATLASSDNAIKLFSGLTDYATPSVIGNPINAKLSLTRNNYGKKTQRKRARRLFIEGWMSKTGTATIKEAFDETGTVLQGTIRGTDSAFFFDPAVGGEFGMVEFGVDTFGGSWDASSDTPEGVGHFRIMFTFDPTSFWNEQLSIETSSYFKLINNSLDVGVSPVGFPTALKTTLSP